MLYQYMYKVCRSYICRLAPRICNCSYKHTHKVSTPDLLMYLVLALTQSEDNPQKHSDTLVFSVLLTIIATFEGLEQSP